MELIHTSSSLYRRDTGIQPLVGCFLKWKKKYEYEVQAVLPQPCECRGLDVVASGYLMRFFQMGLGHYSVPSGKNTSNFWC